MERNSFHQSSEPSDKPNHGEDRFLTIADVQRMFGVSRTTVWRWHAERGLRIVSIGGVTRIRQRDLNSFLRRHEHSGTSDDSRITDQFAVSPRIP